MRSNTCADAGLQPLPFSSRVPQSLLHHGHAPVPLPGHLSPAPPLWVPRTCVPAGGALPSAHELLFRKRRASCPVPPVRDVSLQARLAAVRLCLLSFKMCLNIYTKCTTHFLLIALQTRACMSLLTLSQFFLPSALCLL